MTAGAENVGEYVKGRLDLGYVEGVAADVAAALDSGDPCQVAFQPGDGTFYGLVFVPLHLLRYAGPRVVDGLKREHLAVRGLRYERGAALVVSVEQPGVLTCHLAGSAIQWWDVKAAFDLNEGSAHAVAYLLGRVSAHLTGRA